MRELSLSIIDLAQNSIRSGATVVSISVVVDDFENTLTVSVGDDGCGINEAFVSNISDPFYTTCASHKVGLGVPLFIQRALMTGGGYQIRSKEGRGTEISAVFNTNSVDSVPLGDVSSALLCIVSSAADVDLVYYFKRGNYEFMLDTTSMFVELGVKDSPPLVKVELIKAYLADRIIQ